MVNRDVNAFWIQKIEKATTGREVLEIVMNSQGGDGRGENIYEVGFRKRLFLATTAERAREVCECHGLSGTGIKHDVLVEKWHSLSLQEARQASTPEEAERVYRIAPPYSEAEKVALEKWDELSLLEVERAFTEEEVVVAYSKCPLGPSQASAAAIKKYLSFFDLPEDMGDAPDMANMLCENLRINAFGYTYADYGEYY